MERQRTQVHVPLWVGSVCARWRLLVQRNLWSHIIFHHQNKFNFPLFSPLPRAKIKQALANLTCSSPVRIFGDQMMAIVNVLSGYSALQRFTTLRMQIVDKKASLIPQTRIGGTDVARSPSLNTLVFESKCRPSNLTLSSYFDVETLFAGLDST